MGFCINTTMQTEIEIKPAKSTTFDIAFFRFIVTSLYCLEMCWNGITVRIQATLSHAATQKNCYAEMQN